MMSSKKVYIFSGVKKQVNKAAIKKNKTKQKLLVQRHDFTRCRDKRGIKFFAGKTLDKEATYPFISNNVPHGGEVLVQKLAS